MIIKTSVLLTLWCYSRSDDLLHALCIIKYTYCNNLWFLLFQDVLHSVNNSCHLSVFESAVCTPGLLPHIIIPCTTVGRCGAIYHSGLVSGAISQPAPLQIFTLYGRILFLVLGHARSTQYYTYTHCVFFNCRTAIDTDYWPYRLPYWLACSRIR